MHGQCTDTGKAEFRQNTGQSDGTSLLLLICRVASHSSTMALDEEDSAKGKDRKEKSVWFSEGRDELSVSSVGVLVSTPGTRLVQGSRRVSD